MMIAVLSDIHGNLVALQAVMKKMQAFKLDKVLILGDMVGYYYHAGEVLSILQGLPGVEFIQGNHERYLAKARYDQIFLSSLRKKYGMGVEMALNELSSEQLDWLTNLPSTKTVHADGKKFLMCHGAPRSQDKYIYPNADPGDLDECLTSEHDIIFMGHTHYPFLCVREGVILINVGSVGQPRDIGSLASFVTYNSRNGAIVFHRVPFDSRLISKEAEKIDPEILYLRKIFDRT